MTLSLTARSDTARTIPGPALIWVMTAIGIPVREQAKGARTICRAPLLLPNLYLTALGRGTTCRSLIGTQLFFRR